LKTYGTYQEIRQQLGVVIGTSVPLLPFLVSLGETTVDTFQMKHLMEKHDTRPGKHTQNYGTIHHF
jgi:hypothetical protein